MARVPEEELRRLKREVDLAGLVRRRGVDLKPHGGDLLGLCPFHDDKDPSLVVNPKKNLWNCLGACGEGGSVIDWVMKSEGVSFRHAVEILREAGPAAPALSTGEPPKRSTALRLAPPVDYDAEDSEVLDQVVGYYHDTLLSSPAALEYLESRGLQDPELIERFRLGFADRTLGLRLPDKARKAGRSGPGSSAWGSSARAATSTSTAPSSSRSRTSWATSSRSTAARSTTTSGRARGVWNLPALAGEEEVILCESLIDALTFWRWGFRNVTTAYGVNGFTEEHREALRRFGTRRVLVAYDRDDAGGRAARALAEELAGSDCRRTCAAPRRWPRCCRSCTCRACRPGTSGRRWSRCWARRHRDSRRHRSAA